jgi:hypothetical protein
VNSERLAVAGKGDSLSDHDPLLRAHGRETRRDSAVTLRPLRELAFSVVMEIDVERFIRLRNTVRSAAASVPMGQESAAGDVLATAFQRLRPEVLDTLPEALREEFTKLFPDDVLKQSGGGGGLGPGRLRADAVQATEARSLLEQMAGWLDGVVESAEHQMRIEIEARAYAQERVRAERGVGFRPAADR